MSFQGMIEDVAVADVMQLIRIGGHSGSLTVNNGEEEGIIGFEHGRIVSAWNPRSLRVGELLVACGAIDDAMLAAALSAQAADRPHRPIGQYLVRMGATTPEIIRDVMTQEIERVVAEICAWKSGSFEFAIDDLTPVVEVTRFTGAPKVDLDTQAVLMEVLRRMSESAELPAVPGPDEVADEGDIVPYLGETAEPAAADDAPPGDPAAPVAQAEPTGDAPPPDDASPVEGDETNEFAEANYDGATRGGATRGGVPAPPALPLAPASTAASPKPLPEPVLRAEPDAPFDDEMRMRFQIVSPDTDLCAQLNALLAETGDRISAVPLRDAGASLLGEPPPIVVVDLRHQPNALPTLAALCRSRPRASVLALFEGRAPLREMYQAGVLSVTSSVPATVVACLQSAARQRKYMASEHAIAEGIRTSFARLRRIIADLRSGLLGTSVSSNLMAAVAESLDRGVLFVPHLDRLVALGAFGNNGNGLPLSKTTQGLIVPIGDSGVFKSCLADSRTRRVSYEEARLPQAFSEAVDRPRTGEIAVLPVPGSERVIATVYMDNGARERAIGDIEIFELAAFQLGLALENEFLRRANPGNDITGSIFGQRTAG